MALLALTLTSGVALADRDGRSRDRDRGRGDRGSPVYRNSDRPGGVNVRNTRSYDRRDDRRVDRRVDRRYDRRGRVDRRPIYVNNGRYVFGGGVSRTYRRPVIRQRYYNYRVRPQIIVENYDPVPGYIWVAGQWTWNGREWTWTSGYWQPDASFEINANVYYDGY